MKKLKFFLIPLFTLLIFGLKTTSAYAIDLWPFNDLWNSVKCVADIDCTVRAASTAAGNFVVYTTVGEDFEEITYHDIEQMVNGTWDKGLAAGIGQIGSLAYASPPPMRLADFVKEELADNLLNSQAQAQELTVGTGALGPISTIWSAMRGVAYGLFLIVMVVIGFMIILQKEISPRVVVTVTNALPRIILGLVLITFSLPIIALVVDVVAVFGSGLVIGIIEDLIPKVDPGLFAGGATQTVSAFLTILIGYTLNFLALMATGGLTALILFIILVVAGMVLFGMAIIKLFITYTWILVYTIFSPLIFLLGSLPGQEDSVTKFGKQLLAKTLVFPVMLLFFALALYFTAFTFSSGVIGALTGEGLTTILGNVVFFSIMGPIIALVMLAAAFKAPSLIEDVIGIDKRKK